MRNGIALVSVLLSALLIAPAWGAIDAYQFQTEEHEKRFQDLTDELRCPKCQNQNIADSDAPIAKDLRREVYRMVDAGQTDEDVIDFMVTRYGDFVLYEPKKNSMTWFLWYGPYLALGLGAVAIVLIALIRKKNRLAREASPKAQPTLSSEEQARLKKLLDQDPSNS